MVTRIVICPNCKNQVTIHGTPGEKIHVTCPKCNKKGIFYFSEEKTDLKTINQSYAIEVNNLTKFYNGFKAVDNLSFKVKQVKYLVSSALMVQERLRRLRQCLV